MSALAVLVTFAKTKGTRACAKAVALAFAIALAVTPNKNSPPKIPTIGQMAMMGVAALDPSYEAVVLDLQRLAGQVVEIARAGLKARGRAHGVIADEAHFLDPLVETVASGRTPADNLLERYAGDWQGDLSRIYADYSY